MVNIASAAWRSRRALFIGLGIGAALATAELIMIAFDLPAGTQQWRFLGGEIGLDRSFVADEVLFWKLRSGAPDLEVNELGLRGHLPRGPKHPSDMRIVCVGDSCTFGSEVELAAAYGPRLERALQDRWPDRRVEVVLAALPGYSTWQNRRLLEQHATRLLPDYAVLYCGAWNDYVAAIAESDRARAQASWLARTRLARLWGAPRAHEHAQVLAAFSRDEAPNGRRVPLPDFAANLRAMIELLRATGARVCVVVPPLPAATRVLHPVAADYHAVVTKVARELNTDLVDGAALLSAAESAHASATPAPGDASLCFHDWVHPSAYGHRLLAEALVPLATQRVTASPATDPQPRVTDVEPRRVDALAGGQVNIVGSGLAAVQRVRLGGRGVRMRATADRLVLEVPPLCAPGQLEIVLLGGFGRASAGPLDVEGPALTAMCTQTGDLGTLTVHGIGPPGWRGSVWLSPKQRKEPVTTPLGPFALAGDPDGWEPASALPFPFARLTLPRVEVTVGAQGTFAATRAVTAQEMRHLPATWWAQALLYDVAGPVRGCLSQPVRGTTSRP